MLRATLPIVLGCIFVQAAVGQNPLDAFCRRSPQEGQAANRLSMSFYPLGRLDKSIAATGEAYRRAVGAEDVLARVLDLQTTQLRERVVDRAGFLTADLASTVLFHARGRELIFYPRLLQIHPSVLAYQVRPGDWVGSLSPTALTEDSAVAQAGYPADNLFSFAFPRGTVQSLESAFEIPVVIDTTTPLPTRSVACDEIDWLTFLYELEQSMEGAYRPLDSTFVVAVLSRQQAGFECKLISPLRLHGPLRVDGDVWQTLTDKADEGVWENLLGFQGVRLAAGDRVELTQLERVAPFKHSGDLVRSHR